MYSEIEREMVEYHAHKGCFWVGLFILLGMAIIAFVAYQFVMFILNLI